MVLINWKDAHDCARYYPRPGIETAMAIMLDGVTEFVAAYRDRYEAPISEDAILGDEGIARILLGLRTLLDGELGRLDAGSLGDEIASIVVNAGWADVEAMEADARGV